MQIVLNLVSHKGNKASYQREGSRQTVRVATALFPLGVPPQTLNLGGPDEAYEFAQVTSASSGKAQMPADVAEAAAKLKAFREQQAADREARLTPEQRAKRDARIAEKQRKREEAKAARAAKAKGPVKTSGKKR